MNITANRIHTSPPPVKSQPLEPKQASTPVESECPSNELSFYEVANSSVSMMAGLTQGISRIVVGGCAGAAQGIVHGADLKEDQAKLAFKLAMGANLAATGALAGGIAGLDFLALSPSQGAAAGAATNVMVGRNQWDSYPGSFQDKVRQTSDAWLDSTLQHLPESLSKDTGMLARVTRSTLGNFVGLAAGTYTGVTMMGTNYRQGHEWGDRAFDKAAHFFAGPNPDGN